MIHCRHAAVQTSYMRYTRWTPTLNSHLVPHKMFTRALPSNSSPNPFPSPHSHLVSIGLKRASFSDMHILDRRIPSSEPPLQPESQIIKIGATPIPSTLSQAIRSTNKDATQPSRMAGATPSPNQTIQHHFHASMLTMQVCTKVPSRWGQSHNLDLCSIDT